MPRLHNLYSITDTTAAMLRQNTDLCILFVEGVDGYIDLISERDDVDIEEDAVPELNTSKEENFLIGFTPSTNDTYIYNQILKEYDPALCDSFLQFFYNGDSDVRCEDLDLLYLINSSQFIKSTQQQFTKLLSNWPTKPIDREKLAAEHNAPYLLNQTEEQFAKETFEFFDDYCKALTDLAAKNLGTIASV